ncbi:MAG: CheR family methyltransferase, partial [Burkholderiales bacterium]
VRPELRELITFRPINLLHPTWPVPTTLAAIFCRNIMIYFDRTTQLSILTRFAPLLQADGLLFVGHSESLGHAGHLFRLLQHTVYELAPFTAQRSAAAS